MNIEHRFAVFPDVTIHYVNTGEGFPVVLLHGFPQTWRAWKRVMPGLTQAGYRVIAPDLRGLGDSTCPLTGYDKRTMANDVWRVVHDVLGIRECFLVGHDWGGGVAFALACEHRTSVKRLAIVDMLIPGGISDSQLATSQGRWHHLFFRVPDLPEELVRGRERILLTWFYRTFGSCPDAIAPEDIDEYVRCYSIPGALRASFSYYRTTSQDVADNTEAIRQRGKLKMPVLALGGGQSMGRGKLAYESLVPLAERVEGAVIAESGHWIPDEQPEELLKRLVAFFQQND